MMSSPPLTGANAAPRGKPCLFRCFLASLVIAPEDHRHREKRRVLVAEGGPIVRARVPEALGRDADPLPTVLADDHLHDHFVSRDVQLLHRLLDLIAELQGPLLA